MTYIDVIFPELCLPKRISYWNGWLYYYIIFEITDYLTNKCIGVWATQDDNFHIKALHKCKNIETILLKKAAEKRLNRKLSRNLYDIIFDNNLEAISNQIINIDMKKNKKMEFYDNIKYFILK